MKAEKSYEPISPEPFFSHHTKRIVGVTGYIGYILGVSTLSALLSVASTTGYKIANDMLRDGRTPAEVNNIYWQSYNNTSTSGKALLLAARPGFKAAYLGCY